MDEDATTVAASETGAGSSDQGSSEESQATAKTEGTAEETLEETSADPKADASATDMTDEDTAWLRNKGIDPSDPQAMAKAAKLARDTEREFHKSRQEAKASLKTQAHAAVTDENDSELANEVRQLRVTQQVNEFRSGLRDQGFSKDQIDEIDSEMAKLVESKPYLAHDLDALHALVRSSRYADELKAAEEKGRQAAKQSVARSSAAKAPSGNATTRTEAPSKEAEFDKAFREGFSNPS